MISRIEATLSSTGTAASPPPPAVSTQPGWIETTTIPRANRSIARLRIIALTPALLAR